MHNPKEPSLNLGELVSALNFALNLTATLIPGHCDRAAFIAVRLGEKLGFDAPKLAELRFTVQLKDIGSDTTASNIAEHLMADDIAIGGDTAKKVAALRDQLRLLTDYVDDSDSSVSKLGTLAMVLARKGAFPSEYYNKNCLSGAKVTRLMRFPQSVTNGLLDLNEHWDGSGQPKAKSGADISEYSRIALLAQVADVFAVAYDPTRALQEINSRAGSMLDPELVDRFSEIADSAFWEQLRAPDLSRVLEDTYNSTNAVRVDDAYLRDIVEAFAIVVDCKSPYTTAHSRRVAELTQKIAGFLGLSEEDACLLWRAGMLHDIGKLGISSLILDKPGALSEREYELVRRHALLGEELLARVEILKPLSEIVGRHHEMLDGSGYPRGLQGGQICQLVRTLTVADIFDAMTSQRPYRDAFAARDVIEIMETELADGLDAKVVGALKTVLEQVTAD